MAHLGLGQPCWACTSSPSTPASPLHCFPDPRPLSPGLQAWQGPPWAVPPSPASLASLLPSASFSGSSSSPLVTEPPSSSPSVLPHLSACIYLGPQLFSGNYCMPDSVSEQEMGEGLVPPPRQELGSAQNECGATGMPGRLPGGGVSQLCPGWGAPGCTAGRHQFKGGGRGVLGWRSP